MTTFTALGDSITLGLGDPAPAGGWRGWAVFLAGGLPAGQLHNLATTGAQAADVERTQLPRALELRPDVASVVVGINDTLRRGFDTERGHWLIACRFHDQLAARGHPVGPRPGTEPTSPPATRRDELTWMATKGTTWVLRRCTDLLPYLLAMAVRECFRRPGPEPPAPPALPVPSAGGTGPERAGH
ncbi:MAG TPA: GDSL-type esterase/lipase family protein [Streptosporangiaceae bacterium]|nr:GDSL-type esterase/lipase family protein [Streptosporangiaceae bacterium]